MVEGRVFFVTCVHCGRRRGVFPGWVLVCSRCDYAEASVMPNENLAKDAPPGAQEWQVPHA